MCDSDVSVSEQFRLVLEAYEIEASYGTIFGVYQGELDLGDRMITADFVHINGTTPCLVLSIPAI